MEHSSRLSIFLGQQQPVKLLTSAACFYSLSLPLSPSLCHQNLEAAFLNKGKTSLSGHCSSQDSPDDGGHKAAGSGAACDHVTK